MSIFLVRPDHEPLATCRGLESIDLNLAFLLVKASVATVSQTLTHLMRWNYFPNAAGLTIEDRECTVVFNLSSHPWTLIYQPHLHTQQMLLSESDASALSDALKVPVISYQGSDTGGWLQYHFYDSGILKEQLRSDTSDAGDQIEFQSILRQVEQPIRDGYLFVSDFLQSQDAYIPALVADYQAFSSGRSMILEIKNTFPGEIERIDYFINL